MNQTFSKLIRAVLVIGIVAACGKVALAVPTCPPLCILPPDPAPPMPPINYPDPPFKPTVASNPNSGKGTTTSAAPAAAAVAAPKTTVVGKVQDGAECQSGKASGTLVLDGGKYTCNFMPSTLKVGGACHANNKIGKVTVVAGDKNRYCQIAP